MRFLTTPNLQIWNWTKSRIFELCWKFGSKIEFFDHLIPGKVEIWQNSEVFSRVKKFDSKLRFFDHFGPEKDEIWQDTDILSQVENLVQKWDVQPLWTCMLSLQKVECPLPPIFKKRKKICSTNLTINLIVKIGPVDMNLAKFINVTGSTTRNHHLLGRTIKWKCMWNLDCKFLKSYSGQWRKFSDACLPWPYSADILAFVDHELTVQRSRSRVHFLKCFLSFPLLTAILYSIFLLVLTKFMKATKLRSDSWNLHLCNTLSKEKDKKCSYHVLKYRYTKHFFKNWKVNDSSEILLIKNISRSIYIVFRDKLFFKRKTVFRSKKTVYCRKTLYRQ